VIQGLVSVIVPVKNRPALLREAAAGVFAQTWSEWELLIVDDRSTDETPAVARELAAADPRRVKVLEGLGKGPGPARESGRLAARGEFLQYLDSDDLLLPEKFAAQVHGLRNDPGAGASYGWTRLRRADGSADARPFKRSAEKIDTMFPAFLAGRPWNTSTPLYRAAVCAAAGPWSELWLEEDWEYDCRVAALGTRLHFLPEWVCEYRDHDDLRLGVGETLDPWRLGQRSEAHVRILGHARRAGVSPETAEMAHFARALFLLARQCGLGGLSDESRRLFTLARAASMPARSRGWDFRAYRLAAGLLGWRATARLFTWLRGFRVDAEP